MRARERDGELPVALLHLVLRDRGGAVVRDGGGLDDDVHVGRTGGDRLVHVLGGRDVHNLHIARAGQIDLAGDERHVRAAAGGGLRDRVAHAARGVVREIAHGVQRFLRRAGGDEHALSEKVLFMRRAVQDGLQQHFGLGQLALPLRAAGEAARRGLDDLPAVAAERREVVLRDGVFVHLCIHRRRDRLRAAAGQHRGREHVVGKAVGELGDHVRGRGRDQHVIRPVRDGDVLDAVSEVAVERVRERLVARELLERDGRDKLRGVFRHEHLHVRVLLHEQGRQTCRLVGRNAAGHAENDGLSPEHGETSLVFENKMIIPCVICSCNPARHIV